MDVRGNGRRVGEIGEGDQEVQTSSHKIKSHRDIIYSTPYACLPESARSIVKIAHVEFICNQNMLHCWKNVEG